LQEKGILPADTTAAEFNKLDIDDHTTKEEALAAWTLFGLRIYQDESNVYDAQTRTA